MGDYDIAVLAGLVAGFITGWGLLLSNYVVDIMSPRDPFVLIVYFSILFFFMSIITFAYSRKLTKENIRKITIRNVLKHLMWWIITIFVISIMTLFILYRYN